MNAGRPWPKRRWGEKLAPDIPQNRFVNVCKGLERRRPLPEITGNPRASAANAGGSAGGVGISQGRTVLTIAAVNRGHDPADPSAARARRARSDPPWTAQAARHHQRWPLRRCRRRSAAGHPSQYRRLKSGTRHAGGVCAICAVSAIGRLKDRRGSAERARNQGSRGRPGWRQPIEWERRQRAGPVVQRGQVRRESVDGRVRRRGDRSRGSHGA
jgi:hypothetical protein